MYAASINKDCSSFNSLKVAIYVHKYTVESSLLLEQGKFFICNKYLLQHLQRQMLTGSASGLWRQLRLAAEMTTNEMASWKICILIHIYIYIYLYIYIDSFLIASIFSD